MHVPLAYSQGRVEAQRLASTMSPQTSGEDDWEAAKDKEDAHE
jgi:hypothetical protein